MGSGLLFPATATAIAMATIVIFFLQSAAAGESKMNMVFYMHDNLTGSNETAFPVAGLNGFSSNPGKFGTVIIISNVITKGPQITGSDSYTENLLGRAQGAYMNTDPLTGLDFSMVFTVIFQNMEYSGSTLEMQGTDGFDKAQSEYAVVGGTGKFRFARGYAVCTAESISGENAVLKFDTTFRTN